MEKIVLNRIKLRYFAGLQTLKMLLGREQRVKLVKRNFKMTHKSRS